jgi:putative zinc finger/helix-turn-helix YgiT family protein
MKEEKKTCPSCGEKKLHKGNVRLVRVVGERELTATVTGLVCDGCGESITDLRDGERFDLAIAELLSEAPPTGESFRFLRKVAGLRASDLARMLGLTGDTISRWENGKYAIDRAAFLVLGQIVRDQRRGQTGMLDLIRRAETPRALSDHVEVDLN